MIAMYFENASGRVSIMKVVNHPPAEAPTSA